MHFGWYTYLTGTLHLYVTFYFFSYTMPDSVAWRWWIFLVPWLVVQDYVLLSMTYQCIKHFHNIQRRISHIFELDCFHFWVFNFEERHSNRTLSVSMQYSCVTLWQLDLLELNNLCLEFITYILRCLMHFLFGCFCF